MKLCLLNQLLSFDIVDEMSNKTKVLKIGQKVFFEQNDQYSFPKKRLLADFLGVKIPL